MYVVCMDSYVGYEGVRVHHIIRAVLLHSFDLTATGPADDLVLLCDLTVIFRVHCSISPINLPITSLSIPALRQTRTRSSPGGTVGGTTGLTMNPLSSR